VEILALVGSYRKQGNTDQIVGLIEEGLRRAADQHRERLAIETIYLGHEAINPCRGCRVCFDRGEEKCPFRDDLLAVKAKMKAADGLLLASPVYVDDVSGITKTWIDRLAHVCHRPEFAGRCAFSVATVGGSPTSHTLGTMTMALRTWGFHIAGQAGFKMGALMKPETSEARFRQGAEKVATQLFDAIHERKFARPSFYSLMMFKIQQYSWQRAARQDTVDYQYWQGQGWFEPGCTFYIPHESSPVKVALARFTGRVITRFVAS
jgi:multimeric flavodoxin WrbA